jgi:hypothetical protein
MKHFGSTADLYFSIKEAGRNSHKRELMQEHKQCHSRNGKRKLKRILEGEGKCTLDMSNNAHSVLHFGQHTAVGGSLVATSYCM